MDAAAPALQLSFLFFFFFFIAVAVSQSVSRFAVVSRNAATAAAAVACLPFLRRASNSIIA